MFNFEPATQPTMYFIGVTTGKSSIMKVFPEWAKALGLKDTVMKGIDIEIHAEPEKYRKVVEFIKNDPLSYGALVTTHKIDLYNATKDMFEYLDPYAQKFGELSSISKRGDKLCGHAKDPISSGLALEEFVPKIIGKTIRKRVCLSWVRAEARSPCALTLCALNCRELSVGNRDRQPLQAEAR